MAAHNYRLVKIHRSYYVEEVARLFGIHRNTVRNWIKSGLPTNDDKRPILILGCDLSSFLKARRDSRRRPCGPGEIYCVRCRVPRRPDGATADFVMTTATLGNIVGTCPTCTGLMYRRANIKGLNKVIGTLLVRVKERAPGIDDR